MKRIGDLLKKWYLPIITFALGLVIQYFWEKLQLNHSFGLTLLLIILVASLIVIFRISNLIQNQISNETSKLQSHNKTIEELISLKGVKIFSSTIEFNDKIHENLESLKRHYQNASNIISRAEESIIVFNYIDSHPAVKSIFQKLENDPNCKEKVKECYSVIRKYYEIIEDKIKNSGVNYTRVTMLPLSYPPINKISEAEYSSENKTFKDSLNRFTYEHINKCLNINTRESKIHIKILPFAVSNYSFAIVDNKNLILELDRYNISGYSFSNHILSIKDKEQGDVVKSFESIADEYAHKAFELEVTRDFERTIGEIKNQHLELNKKEIENSIKNYT